MRSDVLVDALFATENRDAVESVERFSATSDVALRADDVDLAVGRGEPFGGKKPRRKRVIDEANS